MCLKGSITLTLLRLLKPMSLLNLSLTPPAGLSFTVVMLVIEVADLLVEVAAIEAVIPLINVRSAKYGHLASYCFHRFGEAFQPNLPFDVVPPSSQT